jgi:hypothetical protein
MHYARIKLWEYRKIRLLCIFIKVELAREAANFYWLDPRTHSWLVLALNLKSSHSQACKKWPSFREQSSHRANATCRQIEKVKILAKFDDFTIELQRGNVQQSFLSVVASTCSILNFVTLVEPSYPSKLFLKEI